MQEIVALVPFSSEDPSRIVIWDKIRQWWEDNFDIPLYVGEDHSEHFNLSLARNDAAKKAGDWKVAVFLDADTLIAPDQIQKGIDLARKTGALTYPYTERWELDVEGTQLFMDDENSDWQQHAGRYRWEALGGCIIVTRDLWDLVRGFDPGFDGWGHEDGAFMLACTTLSGKSIQRLPGKALHLEHTASASKSPSSPVYLANRRRQERYAKAAKSAEPQKAIRQLRDETIAIG